MENRMNTTRVQPSPFSQPIQTSIQVSSGGSQGLTTSSGQHLLQPNRAPSTRNPQTIFVEVTSRDRNYNNLVYSNPMRFTFARPLKDVRAVELVSGTIPARPYNIVDGANSFTFTELSGNDANVFLFTIPPGYYTASCLIQKLNDMMCGYCSVNTYEWMQDPCVGNLILVRKTGTAKFMFRFSSGITSDEIDRCDGAFLRQNTPATVMGFDLADYWDLCGIIRSPFPMDMYSSINRLYLFINLENTQDLGVIERGSGRRWPYAIIYLDTDQNGYKYLNKETFTPVSYSLPQPLSRLQNLYIEFRDEWHRIVNFDGKDFSLLLQFTVLE